ncbi:MAG: hypothetical protein HC881_24585 [Leptolyngbyaceae cyanobacterium SL_7_1]|nr:hypothetical protein [Leptolyngbyaceae cyanobacterium SL_7_1]
MTTLYPPSTDRHLPQPTVPLPTKSQSEVNLAVQSLSAVPVEPPAPVTPSLIEKTHVVAPNAQSPAQSFVFPAARRSRPWLPMALMATAVLAGLTGAGLGWVVRFEQLGQAEGDATGFGFGKDQTFPPLQEWPITGESEVEALQALPSERIRIDREPQARPRRERTLVEVDPRYEAQEPAIAPEEPLEPSPSKLEPSDPTSDLPLPDKEPPVLAPDPIPVEPAPPPVYVPEPPVNPIENSAPSPVIPKPEDPVPSE